MVRFVWGSSYLKATGGVVTGGVVDLEGSTASTTSPLFFDFFRPNIRKRSVGDEDNGDSTTCGGGELETMLTGLGSGLC